MDRRIYYIDQFTDETIPCLGWDAETSYDEWDGFLDYMVENAVIDVGQTMLVAVCRDLPPCRVRFALSPTPALTIIGAVQ